MPFKVWTTKSCRDSFVGSTLRGSFESSISGDKLKDLMNRALQADNATCMLLLQQTMHFSQHTLQANPKGMITLEGTDVAFIGIVKDEFQCLVMLTHGSCPIWGAVCVGL